MAWSRIDDGLDEHPKVDSLIESNELKGLAAVGLWVLTLANSNRRGTDGLVASRAIGRIAPEHGKALAEDLCNAGLYERVERSFQIHDYLDYNPSAAEREREREWDRRRKELFRDVDLVAAIRTRDADRCRYCGIKVDWRDRRGSKGATYDHVKPRGENTLDNVVVACRGCNVRKGGRTPAQASMALLEPGSFGPRSSPDLDSHLHLNGSGSKSDLHTRPVPVPGPKEEAA